jgi:hypothetical protein
MTITWFKSHKVKSFLAVEIVSKGGNSWIGTMESDYRYSRENERLKLSRSRKKLEIFKCNAVNPSSLLWNCEG